MVTLEQLDRQIELQRLKNESQALRNRELELKLQLIERGQLVTESRNSLGIERLKADIADRVELNGVMSPREVATAFGSRNVGCKFNAAFIKQVFTEIVATDPDKFALELTKKSARLKLVNPQNQFG
jgi:hypothetical protein